jgi:hypothetical protein
MGGRGASSGVSVYGNPYGSQYSTVAKSGNIKIIKPKVKSPETLVETMTKGRIYGVLNSKGNLGHIVYFDNENKRTKRIDIDHTHKGLKPHTQHGYLESTEKSKIGASRLTVEEKKMVERVTRIWENKK